jgi:hypothetical protein
MERAISMFPITSARPGESGRPANPYPQPAGTHITSAAKQAAANSKLKTQDSKHLPAPRNIKASLGWLWQEKSALQVIRQRYSGERLRAARSIYLALTEVASNQFTPARAHTSCAYLGGLAGMKEAATRRYLHEFIALGLIAVEPGIHAANTYILLGEPAPAGDLAQAEMPLADGQGNSLASEVGRHSGGGPAPTSITSSEQISTRLPRPGDSRADRKDTPISYIAPSASQPRPARGIRSDTPTHDSALARPSSAAARGTAGDPPQQAGADSPQSSREIPADPQTERILESKTKNQQTNNAGGADSADGDFQPENDTIPNADAGQLIAWTLNEEQQAAQSLTGVGVRRQLAEELAQQYDACAIRSWVRYALRASGLKSKAGFVLSRLAAGEAPPDYPATTPSSLQQHTSLPYSAQPEPSWGLTGASSLPSAGEAEREPPAPSAPAIGQAAGTQTQDAPYSALRPPSSVLRPQHAALWQAAREELRGHVAGPAWGMWLEQVRLQAVTGEVWQLSRPVLGVAETFERRYGAVVAEVLADISGCKVWVEWVRGEQMVALYSNAPPASR